MGHMETFSPIPPAAISRVLATFDRDQLAGFIAVAIDLLDLADGDAEAENGTDLEDDFALSQRALGFDTGPGCNISDRADVAYVEWTTMRASQKRGPSILAGHEDDEDDDPKERDDHDEEDDHSGGAADDVGEMREYYPLLPRYGEDQTKGPINEVEIMRDHHRRLHTDPNYCP